MNRKLLLVFSLALFASLCLLPAIANAQPFAAFKGAPIGMKALNPSRLPNAARPSGGFKAAAADDDVPGVALPTSPAAGTLNYSTDWYDVYSITLTEGQVFYASLDGAVGTDFDLWLFGPGTTSVEADDAWPLTGNIISDYPNGIIWYVDEPGTYYVLVNAWDEGGGDNAGAGDYALSWSLDTGITTSASKTIIPYGGYATISGYFTDDGSPIVGEWMRVFADKGDYAQIVSSSAPVETDGTGRFNLKVTPSTKTKYVVSVDQGDIDPGAYSYPPITITPKAYLSTPTAGKSTLSRSKTYSWSSSLKPRHTAGQYHAYFNTYRLVNHKWKYYKTFKAKSYNYSSYTKVKRSFRLPYAGKWRIITYTPSDSGHYKSVSTPYRFITVK